MTQIEIQKEIAMVAAIMGDCITKKLYKLMQSNGCGYVDTMSVIADWAIEFERKHRKTKWEDVMDGDMTPLSKEMKSIICWDDAVYDFAHYKFSLLKR